jgi:hypothetical protein
MERDGITMLLDRTSDIHGGSHGRWIEQPRRFRNLLKKVPGCDGKLRRVV